MKYLFIDASENKTFIQTGNPENFRFFEFDTRRNLGARITSLVDSALEEVSIRKSELELYAVCTGPGSLTGLRVANSFLRTSSFVADKPLIGVDLFSWTALTLKASGLSEEVRIMAPTLIDKAFALVVDLSRNLDNFIPQPELINDRQPAKGLKNFGIRWQSEGIEAVSPSPQVLHQMIQSRQISPKNDFSETLKVLPFYIIPSQAERKLQEKEC